MNPFLSRISGGNNWVLPVSVMALLLGVMLNMAWITTQVRSERLRDLGPAQAQRIQGGTIDIIEEYKKISSEITKLRDEKTQLESAIGQRSSETSMLNKTLQDSKLFAGLTPVEGPGIKIVLKDGGKENTSPDMQLSPDIAIHDLDVLKVVNELWAAGSEAISVNDRRIVLGSSFRCVGPVIHVDNVPIAAPVTVMAIGDSDALFGGLNLPNGVLDEIRQTDPNMVAIEKVKNMVLPAFTGSTDRKFAKASEPKGKAGNR